jgi:2-oxoglutarate dehydrogenase E1 component
LRVEQLYPWPHKALIQELGRFKQAAITWCQEEPQNMGAWTFVQPGIERALDFINAQHRRPRYVGRAASAATATGLMSKHQRELKALLDDALGEK